MAICVLIDVKMRRRLIILISAVAYMVGVDELFYWLNRRAKRIVTFHNVLSDEIWRGGLANGVSNRLSDFVRIVEECRKRFPISTELFDAKTLTITFDDGYRNQYSTAFKTLQKMGVPAYVFVSGDVLEGKGLLIDRLLHWVAEAPIEHIPNGGRFGYWVKEIWPRFRTDAKAKGETVFAELNAKYPYENVLAALPENYKRERLGPIRDEELDEMRAAGWKVGWHTKSHYPLAQQEEGALSEELTSPPEYRSVCFSYPYGNPVEVGDPAIRAVEKLGYPCAVSNTNEAKPSKYFLPRMVLPTNKYLLHFELSGLKYFLKHRKLLPVYG